MTAYASPTPSDFTLYEDDGRSLGYDPRGRPLYHYRATELTQHQSAADEVKVSIAAAVDVGGASPFSGAVTGRRNVVRLVVDGALGIGVSLDGVPLTERASKAAFDAAADGWYNAAPNLIVAKSAVIDVGVAKEFVFRTQSVAPRTSVNFVCDRGFTQPGESIYIVGSLPELGGWDADKAVRLSPNVYYEYVWNPPEAHNGPGPSSPVWTGVIPDLPPNTAFEWKCLRKREDGSGTPQFEPGANNGFTTGSSGYSGRAFGSF